MPDVGAEVEEEDRESVVGGMHDHAESDPTAPEEGVTEESTEEEE